MKPEDILNSLNDIDEKYIVETEQVKKEKTTWWQTRTFRSLGIAAASLLLVVSLYSVGAGVMPRYEKAANFSEDSKDFAKIEKTEVDYSAESYHIGYRKLKETSLITDCNELGEFIADIDEAVNCKSEESGLSLRESLKEFTDNFFEKKKLLFTYIETSSGSCNMEVSDVVKENDKLHIYIRQKNRPEAETCDMSGWLFEIIFDKDAIDDEANVLLN